MEEVLAFLNERIRDEHGNRVNIDGMFVDAELDSFGTVMVLADMDNEYNCFPRTWMAETNFKELAVRDIINRVLASSTHISKP